MAAIASARLAQYSSLLFFGTLSEVEQELAKRSHRTRV
jgi:hypothetical protein